MKKSTVIIIIIFALFIIGGIGLALYPYIFGNKIFLDTHQDFDYAIIELQNGEVVEGKIKSWTDYDGEQLQVTFEEGTTYLTSSYNCTLIDKE